jgi:hypothetical protein
MADAKLEVEIRGKDKEARAALKNVNNDLKALKDASKLVGGAFLAMGAGIVAGATMAVKKFVEMGDEVQKMSYRTDWAVESLSELRHVAEISGTELKAFELGTRRMSGAIVDAVDGLETYTRAFEKLGLDATKLKAMKPEDAFWAIAEALANMDNDIERSATALDIFGRTGSQLFPMFAEGAEGIKALRQEAHDLGIVFSQETANQAAELKDTMQALTRSIDGVKIEIAQILTPTLDELGEDVTDLVIKFREWSEANPELSKRIVELTTVSGLALVPLGTLLLLAPRLISGLGSLARAFHMTKLAFIGLTSQLGALAAVIPAVWLGMDELNKHIEVSDERRQRSLESQIVAYGKLGDSAEAAAARLEGYAEKVTIFDESDVKLYENLGYVIMRVDELNKAEQEAIDTTDALADATDTLNDAAARLIAEWQYANSEAGKLGVTMREVYEYLLDIGTATDTVKTLYATYGEETANLNALLESQGIALHDVAMAYGDLRQQSQDAASAINALVESMNAQLQTGSQNIDLMRRLAYYSSETVEAFKQAFGSEWQLQITRYGVGAGEVYTPEDIMSRYGARAREYAELFGQEVVPSYQRGGEVERTGLAFLHKGETVFPTSTPPPTVNVNIGVYLDDEPLTRSVIKRITKEVRLQGGG